MTNQEAIERIRDHMRIHPMDQSSEYYTTAEALNMAIEALKAQETRKLTLAELWHMDHRPFWLERKNSRLYITEPSIFLKTEQCDIPSLGDCYILMRENKIYDKYWACDYNKTWRGWSARPTDEQREAEPWAEPPKEG